MSRDTFRCFFVERVDGELRQSVTERNVAELPPGEVTIRVEYSSLNYKDALAATAHPGVVRKLPHIPGIDAAGEVIESSDPRFRPGDKVIATSYEIGAERWGGWSERLRVPADWVLPLPAGLTTFSAMTLGTAGLTAALCTAALQEHGVLPERGEVVVTGATGGVGSLAVMLLAKLGYRVVAVTGKQHLESRLRDLGAARVIARDEITVPPEKPLLSVKYAGGVDTVGGLMLSTLLRQTDHYGCVAACGLVGGAELPITVHPFILRGITLAGISTAWTNHQRREEIWARLAGPWKVEIPDDMVERVPLEDARAKVEQILQGHVAGRVVLDLLM
jgi:putative YhdH/YhfP family quinone oxidoreductase